MTQNTENYIWHLFKNPHTKVFVQKRKNIYICTFSQSLTRTRSILQELQITKKKKMQWVTA